MLADRYTRLALQRLNLVTRRTGEKAPAGGAKTESARRQATRARQRVLADLPTYLEALESRAQEHGVAVYWADGAQQANEIVVNIFHARGLTEALRNHSPLLDEIALDRAAAANDIQLTRLHPGDQIVELTHSGASHPVWPATHLRLEDISAAATKRWRVPETFDPDILASTLRAPLRRSLLRTYTVILGLNFAVAETGSLVCLDRDGHNPSLVALARHVVCLLSIEHVVADTIDLQTLIRAFSQSAWGSPLPTYITQFDRPLPQEIDGPRFIDLILVDNGRSRVLERGYGEALRCIHCGACHNICPVYLQVGGQGYGRSTYSGPIGAVLNPLLLRPDLGQYQPYLSTACGACRPVCPVDIDLPGLLQRQRDELTPSVASWQERFAFWTWQRTLTHPRLFKFNLRLARRLRRARDRSS